MLNEYPCNKCGKLVPLNNDAVIIECLAKPDHYYELKNREKFKSSRHFMPTGTCEGSPSRAQYIKGQPKDSRFNYHFNDEKLWRRSWELINQDLIQALKLLEEPYIESKKVHG